MYSHIFHNIIVYETVDWFTPVRRIHKKNIHDLLVAVREGAALVAIPKQFNMKRILHISNLRLSKSMYPSEKRLGK